MLVLLFDIDGTLLSTSGAGRLAMDAALRSEFGVEVPIVQGSISGRTDRRIATDQFRLHGIDNTPENWRRFIDGYLRHLPESLRTNAGRVLPGIEPLLGRLVRRDNATVGLLTGNLERGARVKLGHYGIDRHFAFGAYGDAHHDRDAVAAEAWQLVQARCGERVGPDDVWVIGDTPWDVRCARAIGARAVAVATGTYTLAQLAEEQPDVAVADFESAEELLQMWR
jgi:phosphoglycolate phosphatase-like HAD superfamily hydrolase